MRPGKESNAPETPVAVAQWIGDDGEPLEFRVPLERDAPSDALSDLGHWLAHQIDVAREVTATPGPRLGVEVERTARSGSSEEVVTPVRVRPRVALAAVTRGDLFDSRLGRMRIERDSIETNGTSCTWTATLRTGRFRERKATLRIGPSPSGNITVLQLVPQSARRIRTRSFVSAGVPAIAELRDRLSRSREFARA